ncbi:MAG: adenylate/guanylate cyclase domain-containing protein [Geminicoccaceae bacterium]
MLEPTPSAAADALRMAFALLAALEQPLPTGAGPPRRLRAAIGIHAGPVLMGDVGGDRQLQFTVGDAVNKLRAGSRRWLRQGPA